jgi:hypothetical protein
VPDAVKRAIHMIQAFRQSRRDGIRPASSSDPYQLLQILLPSSLEVSNLKSQRGETASAPSIPF